PVRRGRRGRDPAGVRDARLRPERPDGRTAGRRGAPAGAGGREEVDQSAAWISGGVAARRKVVARPRTASENAHRVASSCFRSPDSLTRFFESRVDFARFRSTRWCREVVSTTRHMNSGEGGDYDGAADTSVGSLDPGAHDFAGQPSGRQDRAQAAGAAYECGAGENEKAGRNMAAG